MARRFGLLILVVSIIAMLPGINTVTAQQNDMLPPQVIDVSPPPGAELLSSDVLTIYFDQSMDRDAVQKATQFAPAIDGSFTWTDDQTLNFKPASPWQVGKSYVVTIGAGAKSSAGGVFEAPYAFKVRTLSPLAASNVSPAPDAIDVQNNPKIVVSFNRPVIALGADTTLSPITIEPAIKGNGEWVNTSLYVFTPIALLSSDADYQVTIAAGLRSVDGATLNNPYTWKFHTLPPQVLSVNYQSIGIYSYQTDKYNPEPQHIYPDTSFDISFSEPVNRPSVEKLLTLAESTPGSPRIAGKFTWVGSSTLVTFAPSQILKRDTDYHLSLDLGKTAKGTDFKFHTLPLPAVTDTSPKDGDTAPIYNENYQYVTATFNVPIDLKSLSGRISVSPQPAYLSVNLDTYGFDVVVIRFPQAPNTTYTVTLRAGIKDSFGVAISRDYSFSFKAITPPPPPPPPVRPIINGDLMIFPAYKGAMQFPLEVPSKQNVEFALYRWPPTLLGDVPFSNHQIQWGGAGYYIPEFSEYSRGVHCELHPAATDANLVRKWSQTFDPTGGAQQNVVPVTDGEKLPLGLYWVTMGKADSCLTNPNDNPPDYVYEKGPQFQFGVAVATANITLKRGPDSAFVFVTDLQTAKPIANATVTVYADNKILGTAKTDASGTATIPVHMQDNRFILITAEAPGTFAAWYNYWYSYGWRTWNDGEPYDNGYDLFDPTDGVGYLYTDRPIYRPGDTVHFKGILRKKHDLQYAVPDQKTAYLKIGSGINSYYFSPNDNQQWLEDVKVTLDNYGAFTGDFTIPKDVQLGDIGIWASLNDPTNTKTDYYYYYYSNPSGDAIVTFTVADYRAPEFEVGVEAAKNVITAGDDIDATAQARYYFGGAVKQTNIDWNITSCSTSFDYKGPGHYSFSVDSWSGYSYDYYYYDYNSTSCSQYYSQAVEKGTAKTDDHGRALIHSTASKVDGPTILEIEATATDENGLSVSNRTSMLVHPASIYVGVGTDQFIGAVNKPVAINLITVRPDSQIQPNQRITVSAERYVWAKTRDDSAWQAVPGWKDVQVSTDANGKAAYHFTPHETGVYRLIAHVTDEQGRISTASIGIWITDPKTASWYTHFDNDPLVPLADKREYRPGETASLLIPVPYTAPTTVLISVERAGVITHDVVYSDGSGAPILYKLPITDDMAPDAFFNATYIRGIDNANKRPAFNVSQSVRILVQSDRQRLNIKLTAGQSQLKPGETVKFDVAVTDINGKPVVAQVGLKLVDKAVLDLLPDPAGTLFDAFFPRQPLATYTDVSIDGLLEDVDLTTGGPPGRGGGGGGGGGGGPTIRSNFQVTPLWSPQTVTDATGHATVEVKLPDNLTTFQLDARALTIGPDMKVGQSTTDIISSLPLIIRPETPRFLVVGDQIDLAAVVNNNTDQDQNVHVSVKATGIKLESASEQAVSIVAGGKLRVTWRGTVQDAPGADLTFTAIGQNGAQDAAKPSLTTGPNNTIPIYHYSTTELLAATSGVLRSEGSKTESVTLPPRLRAEQGNLSIRVDPSLASTLDDSFTYLRQFSYFCIEQTVDRFLPNVATYKALRQLYQNDPTLDANLRTQLKAATDKLANEQKPDGSWGWYPNTATDPLTSAYAALGLIEAQNAGFSVDTTMLNKAVAYVHTQLESPLTLSDWQLNRQAFYAYVLARHGEGTQADFEALYSIRQRMSIAARAYLLLAFNERFPDHDAVKTLTNDILSSAQFSATGTYWQERETDWYNWGSDTRTTALALTALLRTAPQSDLLPNIVRWLMAARADDHWPTTQETAWSITALSEWMVATDELNSHYRFDVRFNGTTAASNTTKPLDHNGQTIQIAVKDLLKSNRVTVSRGAGTGALYYTAQFSAQSNAADAKAISRGVSVVRQYFASNDLTQPITSAKLGDLITVRLTFTTAQDARYFILEDMFPAGTEAVDTSLLTTSTQATGQTIQGISANDVYWYWGWWYFDHIELRDSETALNATYLPSGTYVYSYQLRATSTGNFQVVPTRAYTFYSADMFGQSEGFQFEISPVGK